MRIVLTTLGSLGDLHPIIALGLELRRRGHDAVVVTTEFYRSKVEQTGLSFRPMRPEGSPEDQELIHYVMDLKKGPEFLIRKLCMPHLREMYEDLATAAEGADFLIAGEVVFAASLVAEVKNLRWAAAILSPFSFFSPHDPSVIGALPFTKKLASAPLFLNRAIINLVKYATRDWATAINDLRTGLGLRTCRQPLFQNKFSPHLNLAMFSELLGKPQPDWPPNTVQTGFVFYDQQHGTELSPSLQSFLDVGEPPIIFTLGSAAVLAAGDFYAHSAEAARMLGQRALLLVGNSKQAQSLRDGVCAVDYAPYSQVFPRGSCVVHQGGIGTIAQVLKAGRPQLVMPYSFDQPDNTARVERLGVARVIERNRYKAERAASQLEQLLADQRYAERAAEASRRIHAEDGLQAACDSIETALRAV